MNCRDAVLKLKKNIENVLVPLIDSDYLYLDLPYHNNLGDTLIWEGTKDFLSILPYKCLLSTNANNRKLFSMKWNEDVLILLHGGGNFGDIWTLHNEYRKKVISFFKKNRIIILPQTIHYDKIDNLKKDAEFYSNYSNVTICARDEESYKILRKYFPNNKHLLLPDMAFCINLNKYKEYNKYSQKCIFVKRTDVEFKYNEKYSIVPDNAFIGDWPSIGYKQKIYVYMDKLKKKCASIDNRLGTNLHDAFTDFYWHKILRRYQVNMAVNFLSDYGIIYTTRLHAAILAVLLSKDKIYIFDNSYGKCSTFYKTWLSNIDNIKLI